jgi:hypothetical protein
MGVLVFLVPHGWSAFGRCALRSPIAGLVSPAAIDRAGCLTKGCVESPVGFLSEILGVTLLIGDRDERGRAAQVGHDLSLNFFQRHMQRIEDVRSRVDINPQR